MRGHRLLDPDAMSKSMLKVVTAMVAVLAFAACAADSKPSPGTSGNQLPSASSSSSSESDSSAAPGATSSKISVTAAEPAPDTFVFDTAGVLSLPAGRVTVTFTNSGTEAHDVKLVRIKDGSFSTYSAAVLANAPTLPTLADEVGSSPSTAAGQTTTFDVDLTAGTYAFVSFLTASDGKTLAQHGMLREFTVTAV